MAGRRKRNGDTLGNLIAWLAGEDARTGTSCAPPGLDALLRAAEGALPEGRDAALADVARWILSDGGKGDGCRGPPPNPPGGDAAPPCASAAGAGSEAAAAFVRGWTSAAEDPPTIAEMAAWFSAHRAEAERRLPRLRVQKLIDALTSLDEMVGMEATKRSIADQVCFLLDNAGSTDGHMLHTILRGPPGTGKCLAGGTRVRVFGRADPVPVEAIEPGDVLVGDDLTPRPVLSVCRGVGRLFRVRQLPLDRVRGRTRTGARMPPPARGARPHDYVVNADHVLSLVRANGTRAGAFVDVPLPEFLAMPDAERSALVGYAVVGDELRGGGGGGGMPPLLAFARIAVEPTLPGPYFGFEITGNGRFLLADGTVTHNTTLSLILAGIWDSLGVLRPPVRSSASPAASATAAAALQQLLFRPAGGPPSPTAIGNEPRAPASASTSVPASASTSARRTANRTRPASSSSTSRSQRTETGSASVPGTDAGSGRAPASSSGRAAPKGSPGPAPESPSRTLESLRAALRVNMRHKEHASEHLRAAYSETGALVASARRLGLAFAPRPPSPEAVGGRRSARESASGARRSRSRPRSRSRSRSRSRERSRRSRSRARRREDTSAEHRAERGARSGRSRIAARSRKRGRDYDDDEENGYEDGDHGRGSRCRDGRKRTRSSGYAPAKRPRLEQRATGGGDAASPSREDDGVLCDWTYDMRMEVPEPFDGSDAVDVHAPPLPDLPPLVVAPRTFSLRPRASASVSDRALAGEEADDRREARTADDDRHRGRSAARTRRSDLPRHDGGERKVGRNRARTLRRVRALTTSAERIEYNIRHSRALLDAALYAEKQLLGGSESPGAIASLSGAGGGGNGGTGSGSAGSGLVITAPTAASGRRAAASGRRSDATRGDGGRASHDRIPSRRSDASVPRTTSSAPPSTSRSASSSSSSSLPSTSHLPFTSSASPPPPPSASAVANLAPKTEVKVVSRVDFVGEYMGQTALKTQKLLESMKPGVLILEEAYSLYQGERDSFGAEAIHLLNQRLSEKQEQMVLIALGYGDMLEASIFRANPGLRRRFGWDFTIDAYKPSELAEIFRRQIVAAAGWTLSREAEARLDDFFAANAVHLPNYGGDTNRLLFRCKLVHGRTGWKQAGPARSDAGDPADARAGAGGGECGAESGTAGEGDRDRSAITETGDVLEGVHRRVITLAILRRAMEELRAQGDSADDRASTCMYT